MNFTIPRRWYSTLPQITVEIGAEYEDASNGVRLGAAVKVVVGQAKEADTRADLTDADLTGAVLTDADLADADLTRAVLTGADLTDADLTGAVLTGAVLTGAVLTDADLTDADLTGAVLTDADLTGAVLTGAVLTGAVLTDAVLTDAVLTDAVLTRAGIPVIQNIDAAILASIEANKTAGKNGLKMSEWHGAICDETNWCETTHCRAGYAICLAGAAGFALERQVGAAAAGALIYAASRPSERVPNFYASNENAMADIRERAAKQMANTALNETAGKNS